MCARGVARPAAQRFALAHVLARLGVAADELDDREPVLPTATEQADLDAAAALDWSRVAPTILGTLLQRGMDPRRRHADGAHYTDEPDIQRVIQPTIVRPWRARIAAATTPQARADLRAQLAAHRVLDPACGSGNFLIIAYRELLALEHELCAELPDPPALVRLGNLHGIDRDPIAAALARLCLTLAARRAGRPADTPSITVADALFTPWPPADAIVGNPPFQAKNHMQRAFGVAHVRALRDAFPDVPGTADYCVYFFRKAHDHLAPGGRAGLVGTNTIRQNRSRDGGLGHIVRSGTIVDAVASAVWPGDAAVHVSIVNWVKQAYVPGPKPLAWQDGDRPTSPWRSLTVDVIGPALAPHLDVSAARPLPSAAGRCFQGHTPGHAGFLLTPDEAAAMLAADPRNAAVLFPYLTGADLLTRPRAAPRRWLIDLADRPLDEARNFKLPFERLEQRVLPARREAAAAELARNASATRPNTHHAQFYKNWWQLGWRRDALLAASRPLARTIVCARVTRRPIFEFIPTNLHPGDSLIVFTFADDYSYGVLQSAIHWAWFTARCSTLKRDYRYTSSSVFATFPWPQSPDPAHTANVAAAAHHLRTIRSTLADRPLRILYRDPPPPLRDAHAALDESVRAAYGMPPDADPVTELLRLNHALAPTR